MLRYVKGSDKGSPSKQDNRMSEGNGVGHGLQSVILNHFNKSTAYLV
jgi:hypothetical protein